MTIKIGFLTEGGGSIGFGHIMRCLTLAKKCSKVRFCFTSNTTADVVRYVQSLGYRVVRSLGNVDLVIRDLAGGSARVNDPRTWHKPIIDIADEAHELQADIGFSFMGVTHYPQRFSGFDYAILRDTFATLRSQGRVVGKFGPVIVTLGGVDPSYVTMPIVEALSSTTRVVGIMGPGYHYDEFRVQPQGGTDDHRLMRCTSEQLARLIQVAPLVVCSAGMTLLECASLGTPALVVAHNEREHKRARALEHVGFFKYLGHARSVDTVQLKYEANHILTGAHHASTMASIGFATVDARGASRVIAFIVANIGEVRDEDEDARILHSLVDMGEDTSLDQVGQG